MNNIDGAIRGQCMNDPSQHGINVSMNDPSQHGINVRFGCPVFLRTGQECYCNTNRCVNEARPATTTSTTTTTTAPLPSGVPTLNPLCIDHDTRCASFKDQLCHATAHAYVIATCARTCNRCDEFIASLHLPTPASTIQQTTSTTTTPKTTSRTLQPTTSTASLTTNKKPVKCNMCGDIDSYIPCFSRDVFRNQSSDCPAGLNFCMTDIFTDADGV
ncbi:salivary glue protein Sgs-3-like [Mytilus californianus]|uniref:salivary glue protein Sgs-3-like n=1 Tax=Mytilus californianus TaxID=6549 RepID=UPI0022465B26|nr:salivary glue protein Sgs-3-like [Mytilus californianus]